MYGAAADTKTQFLWSVVGTLAVASSVSFVVWLAGQAWTPPTSETPTEQAPERVGVSMAINAGTGQLAPVRFARRSSRGVAFGMSKSQLAAVTVAFVAFAAAMVTSRVSGVVASSPVWGTALLVAYTPEEHDPGAHVGVGDLLRRRVGPWFD